MALNETIAASSYPYKPLPSNRSFRLLVLQGSDTELTESGEDSKDSPLRGAILHTHFDDGPSYECLSYTWGSTLASHGIWLDGQKIRIGANVETALRALRPAHGSRTLWVDTICINQTDPQERGQQVNIMYGIFAGASKVCAYLGPEADGSARIPDLIRVYDGSKKPEEEALRRRAEWKPPQPFGHRHGDCDCPVSGDAIWDALKHLLRRPWFSRVWIVQEALAAKRFEMICGQWSISGRDFFAGIASMLSVGHPPFFFDVGPKYTEARGDIPFQKESLSSLTEIVLEWTEKDQDRGRSKRPLMNLLHMFRRCAASDKRDQVYALLNLCQEGKGLGIQPDYTLSVAEVYYEVAKKLILRGFAGPLLCSARAPEATLPLPSWVPDWSLQDAHHASITPFNALTGNPFRYPPPWPPCAGGVEVVDVRGIEGSTLWLSAFTIGPVVTLGQVHAARDDPPLRMRDPVRSSTHIHMWHRDPPLQFERAIPDHGSHSTKMISGNEDVDQTPESSKTCTNKELASTPAILTHRSSPPPTWHDWPVLYHLYREVQHLIARSPHILAALKQDATWLTLLCDPPGPPIVHWNDFEPHSALWTPAHALEIGRSFAAAFLAFALIRYRPGLGARLRAQFPGKVEGGDRKLRRWLLEVRFGAEIFAHKARQMGFRLRVAALRDGRVAMVPRETRLGDVLVVIRGVRVPMVLRPKRGRRFELVGQAYVYGLMSGEALKSKEFKEESIALI